MAITSIVLSIIAILISVYGIFWNNSKHNLNQLENCFNDFCNSLQEFIDLGTGHNLISFKYEIENLYYFKSKNEHQISYNKLQKEFSRRKDNCTKKYKLLIENINFLETKRIFKSNKLLKTLNKSVNKYYLKLDRFFGDLLEINFITKKASKNLLNEEDINFINDFFCNIKKLLDYNVAFSVLKSNISVYFKELSLQEVNFFEKTQKVLNRIEDDIVNFINKSGFETVLNDSNYSKIREVSPGLGLEFDNYIKNEKTDFLIFINNIKNLSNDNVTIK